jgi:hypothetical protein
MTSPLSLLRRAWRAVLAKTKWARIGAKYELHRRAVANPLSKRKFRADEPQLSEVQRRLVAELREEGIASAHFDELIGDTNTWEQLKRDIEAFAEQAAADTPDLDQPKIKWDYYISRWNERNVGARVRHVSADDQWVSLALSDRLLNVVNAYRGLWTKMINIDNVYTRPFPTIERRVGAQNWHRDPGDLHLMKVFVYFSDVDEEAGPFEYVKGSARGGRYGHLWPRSVRHGVYPPPEELERLVAPEDRVVMKGRAGTIIFCDTSGLHRGGFAKSKPRTLSDLTYVSPASVASGRTEIRLAVKGSLNGNAPSRAAQYAIARS